jgi:hypothetical protein
MPASSFALRRELRVTRHSRHHRDESGRKTINRQPINQLRLIRVAHPSVRRNREESVFQVSRPRARYLTCVEH